MAQRSGGWGAFLRLWLVMVFSYIPLKLLFDLLGGGYIDLREIALVQLAALPSAQTVVLWLITWRARMRRAQDAVSQ